MSDYLDRLERELLGAGHRYRADSVTPAPSGRARVPRVGGALAVVLSLGVTCAVVVVVVLTGVLPGGSVQTAGDRHHAIPSHPPRFVGTVKVDTAPACRLRHNAYGLPRLVESPATPSSELGAILSIARQPAASDELQALGTYDRDPVRVLVVFKRFIRIVHGEQGTRLAFFPAVVCNQTFFGTGALPQRVEITPVQAMVMLVLSNPPFRTAILVGTAATISNGPALPGLDLPDNRGWIQATVVPDGVARVVMHFTPPFLHHYTATATIHDNIGIIVRRPDYTPTIVSWYAADGHLIRTFVDRRDLRYEQCLAKHLKRCIRLT
jgi:hypothetical protein